MGELVRKSQTRILPVNFIMYFNRNKVSSWISECSESQYGKSGSTAAKLRDYGNHKFKAHDNEGSLRLYTEVKKNAIYSQDYTG